jgi:hypothetical protein
MILRMSQKPYFESYMRNYSNVKYGVFTDNLILPGFNVENIEHT